VVNIELKINPKLMFIAPVELLMGLLALEPRVLHMSHLRL